MTTADKIEHECFRIKDLLLEKNKKYGDSIFDEGALFQVPPLTAIKGRINDKVSRIKQAEKEEDLEDPIDDLTGYLILLMIARKDNLLT